MGRSLESSRPILQSSKHNSRRFSSYSASPSITPSEASATTNGRSEGRMNELKEITDNISRLDSKPLQDQRFQPSDEKRDYLSKLALTAKVERALRWRMTGQDAVWRPRKEKVKA